MYIKYNKCPFIFSLTMLHINLIKKEGRLVAIIIDYSLSLSIIIQDNQGKLVNRAVVHVDRPSRQVSGFK